MRKPWSISTTVRNPERLRGFLSVLKELEGHEFGNDNQIIFQIKLIQNKLYIPLRVPAKYKKYYENLEKDMPYNVAEEIFYAQKYVDPPMRGRQSANPLNKLGFAIAREGFGPIQITELGNKFLAGDYDIGSVFFKSMLKLQFPNPWSTDFLSTQGFNIMPFIATMQLIYKLEKKTEKRGLDRTEFSVFVPTLINANRIDEYVEKILRFREEKNKEKYIYNFTREFYRIEEVPPKKINNLFDYGDNIMRYFRLTRYFKVKMDPSGLHWTIDLEPSRLVEIEQLLGMYSGEAIEFVNLEDYLTYLSDITKPELPWEKIESLRSIALSLMNMTVNFIKTQNIKISRKNHELLTTDIKILTKEQLTSHIIEMRRLKLHLKETVKKNQMMGDLQKIKEIITVLRETKTLKKYEPEQFEKLITEALKIINDEILIKPNYPVDDDGEPISHSPGNKPDIECYYQTFKGICEVTLNTSKLQWVHEGQPVMRHLREFEDKNKDKEVFCLFIAPQIHNDTYSQFWISVKYEYNGVPQKIVPMTTEQFAVLLETLLELMKQGKRYSHKEIYGLHNKIVSETKQLNSFSEWSAFIPEVIAKWQRRMIYQ